MLYTAQALYETGDLAKSEVLLLTLLREDSKNSEAQRWLAGIYYDLGAMDQAITVLKRLIELRPHDFAPYRLLAWIYRDYERFDDAIEACQKGLANSPPPAIRQEFLLILAKSQVRQRQYAAAMTSLEQLSNSPEVAALRAESLLSLGQKTQAKHLLQNVPGSFENDPAIQRIQARVQLEQDNPNEALVLFKKLVQTDPHHLEDRYQLALTYRKLGQENDYKREMAEYQETYKLRERLAKLSKQAIAQPRSVDIRLELANLCQKLGRPELAAMWNQAAVACRERDKLTVPQD
ncbi:MAG: tetratricopeptide repeat protein [Planctomycetaceae bacterium]|nr:tetratricopeptide repeat protein [Planctomycetaceae bacterium]